MALKIVGYLQEYTMWYMENTYGHALTDIKFEQMTHCLYSGVRPTSPTDPTLIEYAGYPWTYLQRVISSAHAKGCKVLITLADQDSAGVALGPIIDNPTLRSQLITNLKNLVTTYGADGIDIDWEAESAGQMSTARYDLLVNDLYTALNPIGKVISAYYGSYFYSSPSFLVSPSVANSKLDFISIGCYPWYKPADLEARMTLWAGLGYSKSKLLLGVYASGFAIPEYTGRMYYGEIVHTYNPTSSQDHVSATVWTTNSFSAGQAVQNGVIYWHSPDAVRADVNWALANGYGGMMIFDVGGDALNDSRNLLQNIYEQSFATIFRNTGYLQLWEMANMPTACNQVNLSLLTHLIVSDVTVTSATDPTLYSGWGMSYVNTQLTTWANKCHPLGVGIYVDLYDSTTKLASIVASPTLLAQLAVNIKNLIIANNLDGVSLDWEVTKTQAQMDTLINAIYAQLNPIGKEIVIAGNWYAPDCSLTGFQKVNFVNMMTYDMTWSPAVGRLPQHSLFEDMVSAMMLWANAGYDRTKLGVGIPFYGKDSSANGFLWSEIVNNLHPYSNVNQANVTSITGWNGAVKTVSGGVIWWNGLDLVRQKVDWVLANGFGGMMIFSLAQDSFVSGYNMLQTIYEEVTMANIFGPGQAKTATVKVTLTPANLSATLELYLGTTPSNKVATSNKVPFTSTGTQQTVVLPITMPTASGQYHVYIDMMVGTNLIVGFIATEDVIIPAGSIEQPVWT